MAPEVAYAISQGRLRKLLKPEDVAEILGIALHTLQQWRADKTHALKYVKAGGLVRYDPAAVQEFIESRTHSGLAPVPRRRHRKSNGK